MTSTLTTRRTVAALAALTLVAGGAAAAAPAWGATAVPSAPGGSPTALTNTAHLDFLLDEVSPAAVEGHTSYRLDADPTLTLPWTYADARDGGTFERVGGGPLDPATGDYGQGAFNSDDVSRAAVVYLRHWQQTGDEASREKAYEVLRALAYFQTTTGADAGNVVLWMQPDGELNPSAEPVELPDPSDSAESYWLARSLWALGEGYAAFRDSDPAFAAFLQQRLQLGVAAVDREVLDRYGEYEQADGVEVPAWLIVNGADATAEALLGLSAYVEAAPDDTAVRDSTVKLAEGVAAYAGTTAGATGEAARGSGGAGSSGDAAQAWPYGAALPWAESRSMWHAWSSQMAGALARASVALDDEQLRAPAIVESAQFAPTLLTAGGPDNGWYPSPTERVQIAYGADSRVQNLLATADAAGLPGLADLAGVQAAWFFGLNPAASPMYDPATGVTYDGIQPDGSINRNSGAESTIHGLLSMLALDAHPDVAALATSLTTLDARDGLTVVEAETAVSGGTGAGGAGGTVVTPESSWTGESSWSGSYLEVAKGQTATLSLPAAAGARIVEPVLWQVEKGGIEATPKSQWKAGNKPLGTVKAEVGPQGITAVPGALLPVALDRFVPAGTSALTVRGIGGSTKVDALLVRPTVSSLRASGSGGSASLVQNSLSSAQDAVVGSTGVAQTLSVYDAGGALVDTLSIDGPAAVRLPAAGFALALPAG
ncbi:hypothetical protein NVV95_07015 [Herbiconiux sp. CPCC 205716]|uniref:Uncharacterized protein n=1 Tax=Herbiconiux gentiana TaxID=2970912 RepID=A0ABT2GHC1_9MICO|nr:hypothetical protein [Herbiconiux gentiana]MCS5714304.1 hypothetical protein [Herbiconiux gentiana]